MILSSFFIFCINMYMNNRAYKFLLEPNILQEQTLVKWLGTGRFVWNHMLESNIKRYNKEKKFNFKYDMCKDRNKIKDEYEFLKEAPAHILLNKIFDLDRALKRVWKQGNGFPKFKSRHTDQSGICINQVNGHINPRKKQIKIPKMGWVKWKKHRPLEGKLKSITIKKENDRWWVICLCELPDSPVCTNAISDQVVGIDLGLKEFAITSDGEVFGTPKIYRKKQKKLKRKQQILERRKKGSANRERTRKQLNQIHFKIKNQRRDFTHKISSQITNGYLFIAVEELNIRGMIKNRKLAKSVADQGWAMFVNQLIYKSMSNGGCTVKIDRWAPSSKTCSSCGNIQDMPLNMRTYSCSSCGVEMDRDVNAAINIKSWGIDLINRCGTHRIHACQDTSGRDQAIVWSSHASLKQEKILVIDEEATIL